ncbi:membrane-spanning 4-domains subfamily A member 4A-like isoform X2 [Boleophthalmus pectinirostris]|uniref:membrane-spanning 4-domains subfamily A member 4A-like isoform X2 n=1 Tax=Boleophthalmus pectinirostris TaxID=150288 RepID=UPI00242AAC91|nr:membrane-spanning 4-domains subfamily A member 4A-like isoform X2 [Boleophthalmus pectinirostris]
MAEAAVVDADTGLSHSPLVSVSFQRNERRKFKFLEGEPKALGITQVCLILFHMSCIAALMGSDLSRWYHDIQYIMASFFVLIGGCLAIAAKNLHLPTIRACLVMEFLSSVACFFNILFILNDMQFYFPCHYSSTNQDKLHCKNLSNAHMHLFAELLLVHVALFAISVTLMVYACKGGQLLLSSSKRAAVSDASPSEDSWNQDSSFTPV